MPGPGSGRSWGQPRSGCLEDVEYPGRTPAAWKTGGGHLGSAPKWLQAVAAGGGWSLNKLDSVHLVVDEWLEAVAGGAGPSRPGPKRRHYTQAHPWGDFLPWV